MTLITRSEAGETILQADRVPVFIGVNSFNLKQGLQSSNRTVDIPNELIKEQGNSLNRGVAIQSPQLTVSFEDLAVDLDMEQILSESWATVGTRAHSVLDVLSGVVVHAVGPTNKITGMVLSYVSGASTRVGAGGSVTSVTATSVTLTNAADAVNFAVGNVIVTQRSGASTPNLTAVTATVTEITGAVLTTTGFDHTTLSGTGLIYAYVNDDNPVNSIAFTSGAPATSLKGLEVFVSADRLTADAASTVYLNYWPITASGTATDISSNSFRDSEVDILMLYNDYDDNPIFTRYIQDAAVTSIGFNYSADGNATQSYDFQSGKSIDYAGYVNRRAAITDASIVSGTGIDLSLYNGIFVNLETPDPIATNTTLNENSFEKNFLKVKTLTTAGVPKVWTEVASGTSAVSLTTSQYKYVSATSTITFGETLAINTRMEFTYLCDAGAVLTTNAYKFDETAFSHYGTPDVITGKYQPLTINSSDGDVFTDRIDGVESTTFTVGFTRDFFMAQGIISQRVKPAQIGTVDGSFTTREGFSKIMSVLTTGDYTSLTDMQQMDVYTSAAYTNTTATPLRVRLYDPKDNTTEVKTVEIDEIQVTNTTNSNSVSDDSTFEVSFLGKKGNLNFSR